MSRVTFTPSSTCKTKWKPAVTIQKKYMTDSLNTNSGKAERCEVFDLHHQQQKLLLKGVNQTQKKSCSEKASSELYTISELLFIAPDSRKYVCTSTLDETATFCKILWRKHFENLTFLVHPTPFCMDVRQRSSVFYKVLIFYVLLSKYKVWLLFDFGISFNRFLHR